MDKSMFYNIQNFGATSEIQAEKKFSKSDMSFNGALGKDDVQKKIHPIHYHR